MVQQVFLLKKAFYISREPGTHKFGTSKIVHPKCAIWQLHDITFGTVGTRFFFGDPWGPKDATWVRWATWPDMGLNRAGKIMAWDLNDMFFSELSIRYFVELIDLIATYCSIATTPNYDGSNTASGQVLKPARPAFGRTVGIWTTSDIKIRKWQLISLI